MTGEAVYTDDLPRLSNELQGALVLSKVARGRIASIDISEAKKVPGFRGFFTKKDVLGDNKIGDIVHNEDLFADEEVTTHAQTIGIAVCDDERDARRAAALVRITYADSLQPPILTIEEAIAVRSFIPDTLVANHHISKGDIANLPSLLSCSAHRVQGEIASGPQ